MIISSNGDNLDALLDQYEEGRNKGQIDWNIWEKLYEKRMKAIEKTDWDVLEKFAKRNLLKDFKTRKLAA